MKYKFALLLLFFFLVNSVAFGESFRNPVRIDTGSDPDEALVADLNGDGKMDILSTTHGVRISDPSTVQAFLAQSDGSFLAGPVTTLPQGVTPFCQVADETKDGKADLICPYADQFNASLYVFPGNGDGTFGAPIMTPLPSSQDYDVFWAPAIGVPADFNGDGVPDLIVANGLVRVGYVILGNGDGTFRVATGSASGSYSFGDVQYQALDLRGDGHVDLVFSSGAVFLGDGTGQFAQAANGGGTGIFGCVFGKLDGEPHIDKVCGGEVTNDGDVAGGTQLLIYHGNGDGSFNPAPVRTITYGGGFGTFQTPVAIVDLNGDGIPDIVAEASDGLTVLLGKTNLSFSYPAHYATGYAPSVLTAVGQFILRIADVNGDGLPDIVESGPNGIYIAYGRPDGIFDTAQAHELAQVIDHLTVADFNGDGIPDIAATGDHAIELSLGKGDGTFEYRRDLPQGSTEFNGGPNARIVHGDFNGDHRQDLMAVGGAEYSPQNQYILFGYGDGTFKRPAAATFNSQSYPVLNPQQVFDFNGDGKDDLFTSDFNDLYVALSKGDGSFKVVTTPVANSALNTNAQPAIADLAGNGKLDAVFGRYFDVAIYKGNGDGSFDATPTKLSIPPYDGVAVQFANAVAVGDFDGDGHKDIALLALAGDSSQPPTDAYQSVLFVYWGNGDGTFSAADPVAAFNRNYSSLYVSDLNKDGLDDLVLTSYDGIETGAAVGILDSLGGRKFGPEVNYYAGGGLVDLAVVDLNGDGFPDLVLNNGGDINVAASSATVLMNLGNTTGVTGSVYALAEPSDAGNSFQLVASLDAPDQSALSGSVSFFIDGQAAGSAALADNQAKITISKAYSAGVHNLKATWGGNSQFAAVTLTGKHQVANGYPTSTTVSCNYTGSTFLTPITFTAAVQSTSGIPVGSVELLDGKSRLAVVPLAGGAATYVNSTLLPGTHTITAQFIPNPGWAASSGSLQQQVEPANVTTSVIVSARKVYAMQPFEATAKVEAPAGGPEPKGSVQFFNDLASPVGTSKLLNGTATITTSLAFPGYGQISAEYSGNRDYNQGYAQGPPVLVVANPTLVRVLAAPDPAAAGQEVTLTAVVSSLGDTHLTPTGSVEFFDNGGPIGNAELTGGSAKLKLSSLAVGTHPITVSYSADTAAFTGNQSKPLSLVIRPANSTTTLAVSPNPATVNSTVTMKAVVKGPRQPTGSVIFYDGSTKLSGAIQVDFEGAATFSTSSLAVGTHSIVADYTGDPNLTASDSTPVKVTITQ